MDAQDAPVHLLLVGDTVVLELQIQMLRAEDIRKLQGIGLGVFILAVAQPAGDLACQTRRQGDKPFAVAAQQFQIDTGLDVKALRPAGRHQVGKVPIALLVFAQQHQMAALGVELMDLVEPGPALGRHIDLAADDGLDALRLAGTVKVDGAVHDAVVRDGAGVLPHGLDDPRQVPDAAGAVQKAIFRMDM